jgi:hypothetical protein
MRIARAHSIVAFAVVVTAAACASSGGAKTSAAAVEAPRMVSRGSYPALRINGAMPSGRSPVRLTLEVEVDESGRPDMSTLKLTGKGAGENRQAIQQWIAESVFRPGTRNGVPVRALLRMQLEANVQVRRRG